MPPPPEGMNWPGSNNRVTFQQLLSEFVAEITETGFVNPRRIEEWITRLRNVAEHELGSDHWIDQQTKAKLGKVYERLMKPANLARVVPGIKAFNISIVAPKSRAELDRRIFANAALIKLRKQEAVERTIQRASGWCTSIPQGGDETVIRREVKADIGKSVAQFRYEARRVDIDQSLKLIANVSDIVAVDSGAIAGEWHDHGEHDKRYNARKEHMERAGRIYLVRGSWAVEQGLIKALHGYTDEITAPSQEVFCRCFYRYIVSPRRLPEAYLTQKGRDWIERGRIQMEGLAA